MPAEPGTCEKSTPDASDVSMSASTATVKERFRMFGATDSGTSAQPG